MTKIRRKASFRRLFRLSRLIPGATLLGAAIAIVLSLLGKLQLSLAESMIIALLGLLAADALTERITLLDRLERALLAIRVGNTLRPRQDIIPIQQHGAGASEICILAVSAISIAHTNAHFFAERLSEGCSIKLVLLNPRSPHLKTFDLQYGTATAERSIGAALDVLEGLIHLKSKGTFEIRLSEVFLPFSMVAVDSNRDHGSMLVEFYAYRKMVGERPHIHLTANEDPHWFSFYRDQFHSAWSDSILWLGKKISDSANDAPNQPPAPGG